MNFGIVYFRLPPGICGLELYENISRLKRRRAEETRYVKEYINESYRYI